MKTLNQKSASIFSKIINKMQGEQHLKIETNKTYLPLTVEKIGEYLGSKNKGNKKYDIISMAHYSEQNGDAMRDPEMCFLYNVEEENGKPKISVIPFYFRNDYVGSERWSISGVEENSLNLAVNVKRQADDVFFAQTWLKNIKEQQEI